MKTYFDGRIHELDKAIARETSLLATLPARIEGSWFQNQIFPLNALVPDHPGVALLVAAYNRESARRAAAGLPVGITPPGAAPAHAPAPAAANTPPAPTTYAGTATCGGCHKQALAVWRTTKHAHALEALAKVKRDRDPACIGCHVTGYLRPGGTSELAIATKHFSEVGCEACHGPGLAHATASAGGAARPVPAPAVARKVSAAVCLECHTPDQTGGDFDYVTFLKAVLGPGHGG
jgi:hypothetical protein